MAAFPVLSSGAVTQYPTNIFIKQSVQVLSFLDGCDQRFLNQGSPYRRWQIDLEQLNELEIQQIEHFYAAQQGEYSTFSFPDPISNQIIPNCRLDVPQMLSNFVGVNSISTCLWVVETNG